jgi:hypothetical protein
MLNPDFKDMLLALSEEKVEYLIVGAYAMAMHGYPRTTMDIDIWFLPTPENAEGVLRALERFGAPVFDLTREDLQSSDTVFQIGLAPRRIDLMTSATGLDFAESYGRSVSIRLEGLELRIPCIEDLIANKRASGRTKDLADVEALESLLEGDASD